MSKRLEKQYGGHDKVTEKKNTLWKLSTESRYENIALLIQL